MLIPDHVGGRMATELGNIGYHVTVLKDRVWTQLSTRIKVISIADYNQDAILLVEIGKTLVVNLNDAGERGWEFFVRSLIKQYDDTILLQLFGFGENDEVANVFEEHGERLDLTAVKRRPIGQEIAARAEDLGVQKVVPFSSLHKYQRADSVWANVIRPELDEYTLGFQSTTCQILPAYIRYDCLTREYQTLNPTEIPERSIDPKEFGDDWDETLDNHDVEKLDSYFRRITHIPASIDYLNFVVGEKDHRLEFRTRQFKRGITFEVPRNSLMKAVEYEVFDDILLSNFMKIRLEGKWPKSRLRPDFIPYAKYSDNGRARTPEEIQQYFAEYQKRAPADFFRHRLPYKLKRTLRAHVDPNGALYRAVKRTWRAARRTRVSPW